MSQFDACHNNLLDKYWKHLESGIFDKRRFREYWSKHVDNEINRSQWNKTALLMIITVWVVHLFISIHHQDYNVFAQEI